MLRYDQEKEGFLERSALQPLHQVSSLSPCYQGTQA